MEPYRTAGFQCPSCPSSPLREFHHRMICDECRGMLISEADFASACADLDGREVTLAVTNEKPVDKQCPKCERSLSACRVAIQPTKASVDVLRCSADGLWCKGGLLEGVFAHVSRKRPGNPGVNYGRALPNGPDGLPTPQLRGGTGLRISEWR